RRKKRGRLFLAFVDQPHAPVGDDDLVLGAKSEREREPTLPAVIGDAEEAPAIAELMSYYAGKSRGLPGKRIGSGSGAEKKPAGTLVVAGVSGVGQDCQKELRDRIRVCSVVRQRSQDPKRGTVVAAQHRPDTVFRGRLCRRRCRKQ